ncbi:redoxin domain-containing protein [Natronococcus occultus]|uniref:Peroxiredoxin n=1 Tax=Natronococcus occultus SP4 TaxID=694430 RepID=L0JVN1_9EURY|nr:redoxin domain-containing protein [Natronococcus occultus]AGB35913.1 Peroxiredoxin [Natronococcus occultus SP4]
MPEFDVVELEPTDHIEPGETAPDFTRPLVTDEFWEDRSLAGLVDGRTVLVFTPMIGSFVAKYVWDELADRGWLDRDERFVGVTASTPYGVSRFLDENDLPVGIVADPANEVADDYGLAHDLDGMAGVSEPRLAFVVLDADRAVEAIWVADEWPEFPNYDELESELGLD